MTRDELIEAILQEIMGIVSPASTVAKSGMRLAKHDVTTVAKKMGHRMKVATGKAKAGSHWSK